jgi:hypothetical protein
MRVRACGCDVARVCERAPRQAEGEGAVVVLFTWLRFMATRQLVWNKNYNVKPREISAAQNGLTATLCRHVRRCSAFVSLRLAVLPSSHARLAPPGCTATGRICAT